MADILIMENLPIFAQSETLNKKCFNMREAKKTLTDTERASLIYKVATDSEDWKLLYQLAHGIDKYNSLTDKTKQKAVSTWKNSIKIVEGLKSIEYEFRRKEEEQRNQITEEIRNQIAGEETEPTKKATKGANTKETDFLNRDEFLKFLNTRANEITDDKLRNDILKMLSDNMRYKESEKDEEQEIQRFYTPKTCELCEIYNKCRTCKVDQCPKL